MSGQSKGRSQQTSVWWDETPRVGPWRAGAAAPRGKAADDQTGRLGHDPAYITISLTRA